MDVNEAGIRAGLTLARQAGLQDKVHFRQADVREPLPFPDGAFDAIVCMDAMCHLPDRGRCSGSGAASCGPAAACSTPTRSW